MAKEKVTGGPGQTVELADKETSFYDPQTQLDLSRDQTAKLGDTVGKKTQRALLSGRLLIVGGSKPKAEAKADGKTGPTRPELIEKAKALGVPVKGKNDELAAAIAEAEKAAAGSSEDGGDGGSGVDGEEE